MAAVSHYKSTLPAFSRKPHSIIRSFLNTNLSFPLHLVFIILSSFSLVTRHAIAMRLGGYQPIPDTKDPYIKEVGEFAVAEHNKQSGQALVFLRVVSGEQQVVDGTNYKLDAEAEDAGASNMYEAVVYDKPWENVRELVSFKPIP